MENPLLAPAPIGAWSGAFSSAESVLMTQGTVDAAGNFKLELPVEPTAFLQAAELEGLCQVGTGEVTVNPPGFRHVFVFFLLAFETTLTPVGETLASSQAAVDRLMGEPPVPAPGDVLAVPLYLAEPARVAGSCTGEDGFPTTYAIDAPAGWTYLVLSYPEGTSALVTTSADLPAGVAWRSLLE